MSVEGTTTGSGRKPAPPRHKTVIAFEKVHEALRILEKPEWRNGQYQGGTDEVRNVLAYFRRKYGV